MIRNMPYGRAARIAVILVVLALLVSIFGTTSALAARDRTPPTKPSNQWQNSTYDLSSFWGQVNSLSKMKEPSSLSYRWDRYMVKLLQS